MDALRYHPSLKSISLDQNVQVPQIESEDDVIVEVAYAGLCGTDIHIMQGEFPFPSDVPLTLGHEFSGFVYQTGTSASHLKIGTRVAINPNNGCKTCKVCLDGNYHFCQKGSLRTTIGIGRNGSFAKFCIVPLEQVYLIPDSVTLEQGALCEPLSCILRGWDRLQKNQMPKENSKILLLGTGIIGNLWMSLLHHHGYRNVIVSELSEIRRQISRQLQTGFQIVSPDELRNLMPKSKAEAEVEGVDVIIDCTGSPKALEQAIAYVARGATILVFGCAPVGQPMKICPEEIFSKELTIMGTMINPHTYGRTVCLVQAMGSRYLDMEKLGIEIHTLENYKPAMDKLKRGEISKVMFDIKNSDLQ